MLKKAASFISTAFVNFVFLFTLLNYMTLTDAISCTRILNVTNQQAVLVGRTMDWHPDMPTTLWVLPRGIERDGMAEGQSLKWVSKYGSVVALAEHVVTSDGFNEKGLGAHILWLKETDYGARQQERPGLSVAFWAQFYLDNFADVDEAVRYTQEHPFQLDNDAIPTLPLPVHLALEDAKGDSAVIEIIKGETQIYHRKAYTLLTNSPTYDLQLKNLKQYRGLGGEKPLPGTTYPTDRFVRGQYYNNRLGASSTVQAALRELISVLNNVSEPYGMPDEVERIILPTIWRSVSDLTHKIYYFNSSDSLNYSWTNLSSFNLSAGTPVMEFDVAAHPDASGDISTLYKAK